MLQNEETVEISKLTKLFDETDEIILNFRVAIPTHPPCGLLPGVMGS